MWAWQFAKALHTSDRLGLERFKTMQDHYNLAYREEEREMIPPMQGGGRSDPPLEPTREGFPDREVQAEHNTFEHQVQDRRLSRQEIPQAGGLRCRRAPGGGGQGEGGDARPAGPGVADQQERSGFSDSGPNQSRAARRALPAAPGPRARMTSSWAAAPWRPWRSRRGCSPSPRPGRLCRGSPQ